MRSSDSRARGGAIIEFVLVTSFILVPLILGLLSIGFTLSRSLQAAQLTRDVGRMFVRGVDFAEQPNQDLITGSAARPNQPGLAQGMGMAGNGGNASGGTTGNGEVILSVMLRMPATCGCANSGRIVVTRRIIVGNKNLYSTSFGNPAPELVSSTTGSVSNYAGNTTARADSFSSVVNLSSGELAYLVESKFNFPDLAMPGVISNPGVYWRSVF
jgi:hypothetical protein